MATTTSGTAKVTLPAANQIQITREFNASRRLVWRALTEPELLARWWAEGDIKPVVGHRFTLDMGKWGRQP